MRALYLFDAMISGVHQYGYKRECDETDYELICKLMNWTLNGGDTGNSEIDWFLQNEWKLFLLRKRKEIKLNLDDIDDPDNIDGRSRLGRPGR